jgi:hypothetical protein
MYVYRFEKTGTAPQNSIYLNKENELNVTSLVGLFIVIFGVSILPEMQYIFFSLIPQKDK